MVVTDVVDDSVDVGIGISGEAPPAQFGGAILALLALGIGATVLYHSTRKRKG